MFEVKLNLGDGGFLSRLGRARDVLFRRGRVAEHKLAEMGPARAGRGHDTDAEESLAMALGKDVRDKQRDVVRQVLEGSMDEI